MLHSVKNIAGGLYFYIYYALSAVEKQGAFSVIDKQASVASDSFSLARDCESDLPAGRRGKRSEADSTRRWRYLPTLAEQRRKDGRIGGREFSIAAALRQQYGRFEPNEEKITGAPLTRRGTPVMAYPTGFEPATFRVGV